MNYIQGKTSWLLITFEMPVMGYPDAGTGLPIDEVVPPTSSLIEVT